MLIKFNILSHLVYVSGHVFHSTVFQFLWYYSDNLLNPYLTKFA